MKKMLIYFQLILFSSLMQVVDSLGLDVSGTQILASKDQFRIKLKPVGNSKNSVIEYTRKPSYWLATERYLFVPKKSQTMYNQVLISVVIKDPPKQQYKLSLIFLFNSQNMFMDSTVYQSDSNMSLEPITTPITNSKVELQRLINKILMDARNSANFGNTESFTTLFEQILSQKDVEQSISTNNIPAMIKLISKIPTADNTNCIQQISYLSQVSAIAHDAMYQKKLKQYQIQKQFISKYQPTKPTPNTSTTPTTNTSKTPVSNTSTKPSSSAPSSPSPAPSDPTGTQKLSSQTQSLIQSLRSQSLVTQKLYIDQIQNYKQSYIKLNNLSASQQQLNEKITENAMKLDKAIRDMESNYSRINDVNYLIPRANQKDKAVFQRIISDLKTNGDQMKVQVQRLRTVIRLQENKLKGIRDEIDKSKLEVKNMQSSVLRTQQTLSNIYQQLLFLYQPINSQQNIPLLYILQNKLITNLKNTAQIDSILQQRKNLALLSSTIWYLDEVFDKLYYQCYGIENTNSSQSADIFVYQINYGQFMQYVRKFTQKKKGSGLIFQIVTNTASVKKIVLQRSNVLSSIWTKKFGEALQLSYNQTQEFNIAGSVCYAGEALDGYRGIILEITGNVVQVQMDGSEVNYVLHGACSRVQMVAKLPQKGNLLFWRGRQISKNLYDSYYSLIL